MQHDSPMQLDPKDLKDVDFSKIRIGPVWAVEEYEGRGGGSEYKYLSFHVDRDAAEAYQVHLKATGDALRYDVVKFEHALIHPDGFVLILGDRSAFRLTAREKAMDLGKKAALDALTPEQKKALGV